MSLNLRYLAPEYFIYGRIDEKIDIYAFGVVLLELISGRRPVSTGCPKVEREPCNWAKPILVSGKFELLVDPLLGDNYVAEEMERLCLAAGAATPARVKAMSSLGQGQI
ncbi:hypothetical protein HPP92_004628 [Vanilla planifolia]|uniref:Protein kinase domain-containing protein n=1 Tax=Vanilla planifolia TaxID=51239 RepID=A0A835VBU7_VANPL|nr:hypothetical protein HPP92_004628 [Vanilla planifolia]